MEANRVKIYFISTPKPNLYLTVERFHSTLIENIRFLNKQILEFKNYKITEKGKD